MQELIDALSEPGVYRALQTSARTGAGSGALSVPTDGGRVEVVRESEDPDGLSVTYCPHFIVTYRSRGGATSVTWDLTTVLNGSGTPYADAVREMVGRLFRVSDATPDRLRAVVSQYNKLARALWVEGLDVRLDTQEHREPTRARPLTTLSVSITKEV